MAILEVKNLHKSFGKTEVLKGIDLSLEKGQVLSLIGSSGSGKTTLLRCLNFLEMPDAGTISVDGEALFDGKNKKRTTDAQIRRNRMNFGLVFQQFNLFPQYSVFGNLCLAPKLMAKRELGRREDRKAAFGKIENKAREVLEQVGLTEKANSFPCELSGGQQQRVAIARALMLSPKILCFDEPTSALDPELTGEVLRVLKELAEKHITMIIVTHEMNFAREVSDKIVFMADGVVEEEGAPQELFDNPRSERLRGFLSNSL